MDRASIIAIEEVCKRCQLYTKHCGMLEYPSQCVNSGHFIDGYRKAERDLGWHSVKEMLPPIDEEVIVLTDNIHGKIVPGSNMICYAHRPNPKGWDGKNIETGEVKHYDVVTYDGWNIPGVTHWMHCPKLEEE